MKVTAKNYNIDNKELLISKIHTPYYTKWGGYYWTQIMNHLPPTLNLTTHKNISKQTKTSSRNYPIAELLYVWFKENLILEYSRKRDIENRTGILIALLGALIGFIQVL